MGYALQYDFQTIKVTTKKKKLRKTGYIAMTALLVLCTVAMFLGGTVFQTILLGKKANTQNAAEQMVVAIQQGTSFQDAVETFYAELVQ